MVKWLGWVIVAVVVFVAVLFGIKVSLGPDSLKNCSNNPSDVAPCEKADAIVAVSGGNTNQRTEHAINLYKKGWADKLIFSGADSDPSRPSNAANMRDQAIRSGVPEEAILLDETSQNTHENAVNVVSILEEIGAKNVILVSSSYHMRRVEIEFRDSSDNISFRTSPAQSESIWENWWISPRGWWLAFYEIGGIVLHYVGGALQ